MKVKLTENQLYKVIYQATKDVLNEIPLYERTHRSQQMRSRALRFMTESSVNRILSHGQYGFIVVSGNRSKIEDPNPELNLNEQCTKELTVVFKTVIGIEITEKERGAEQYDGFDYRYKKLVRIFENRPNINDVESAVTDDRSRDEWLKVRNEWADVALMHNIKDAGYAWSKAFGGYHGQNEVVDSFEPNYIVYNHRGGNSNSYGEWQDLFNFAVAMCGKYTQECVYVQAPNEAPVWVNMHGQVVSGRSSKNVQSNQPFKNNEEDSVFYTTNKRKKNDPHRFTADIEPMSETNESIRFEDYLIAEGPSTYNGRIRCKWFGEVFLTE